MARGAVGAPVWPTVQLLSLLLEPELLESVEPDVHLVATSLTPAPTAGVGAQIDGCRPETADLWLLDAREADVVLAAGAPLPPDLGALGALTRREDGLGWHVADDATLSQEALARYGSPEVGGERPRSPSRVRSKPFVVLGVACTSRTGGGSTCPRSSPMFGGGVPTTGSSSWGTAWGARSRPSRTRCTRSRGS